MGDYCLVLNHGSTEDGVHIKAEICVDTDDQKWQFVNGKMQSMMTSTKCVTAGYSFVQSVAFVTPENKKVLVVVNQNSEDADFEIHFEALALETSIPSGAIQAYIWV